MARTRTLAQLRAEVRQRADIENSQHITDAEINRYVNQSCAHLHALMVEANESYFVSIAEGAAVAPAGGFTTLDGGATFYKLLAVWAVVHGRRTHLERFDVRDLPKLIDTNVSGPPYYYTFMNDNDIVIAPPLPTGTTVGLLGVLAFTDLSGDSSTFDGRDGWEEWVVLDSAIKCLNKEESDARALMAERERVEERILSQLRAVDHNRPSRVRDTGLEYRADDEIRVGRMP